MGYKGKLVRDKIPEIIEKEERSFKIEKLSEEEYRLALNKKLLEEVDEYLESGEIEELADIEEVILSILELKGSDYSELEEIRKKKAKEKGSFKKRIFLCDLEEAKKDA